MSGDLASKEPVCGDELRIIYERGQPHGIRDRSGFLFFFRRVSKFAQETRYRRELEQMTRLADFLLSALRTAEPPSVATTDNDLLDTAWKYQCASKTTAEYRFTRGGMLRLMRHLEREWRAAEKQGHVLGVPCRPCLRCHALDIPDFLRNPVNLRAERAADETAVEQPASFGLEINGQPQSVKKCWVCQQGFIGGATDKFCGGHCCLNQHPQ